MQQNLFNQQNLEKPIITFNDKKYRFITKISNNALGRWEFYCPLPNGKNWHNVLNFNIRHELDNLHKAL